MTTNTKAGIAGNVAGAMLTGLAMYGVYADHTLTGWNGGVILLA